ncbi:MAG: hypothetical protein JWQ26_697 [Modestobacter sp.]|nr:hypothetical protein [Modestobacter sp.]
MPTGDASLRGVRRDSRTWLYSAPLTQVLVIACAAAAAGAVRCATSGPAPAAVGLTVVAVLLAGVAYWTGGLRGAASVEYRSWLLDAVRRANPGVESVHRAELAPTVGARGAAVVTRAGVAAAVRLEHRTLDSGPLVVGEGGPEAFVRLADDLNQAAAVQRRQQADRVRQVAELDRRAAELDRLRAETELLERQVRQREEQQERLAAALAAGPLSADVLRLYRESLELALRHLAERPGDPLLEKTVTRYAAAVRRTEQRLAGTGDPLAGYERELRGQPAEDLEPGECHLYSAEWQQEDDGWHRTAYEGRSVPGGDKVRWATTRAVLTAVVADYMAAHRRTDDPAALGLPRLRWDGDDLVVLLGERELSRSTPADGLYEVPQVRGLPWHVLPAGERAGTVHHLDAGTAPADAGRALHAGRGARGRRGTERPRPPTGRPFVVSCDWMRDLPHRPGGPRSYAVGFQGVPVRLEDGREDGRPNLVWWTTRRAVQGLREAIDDYWAGRTAGTRDRAWGYVMPRVAWDGDALVIEFGGPRGDSRPCRREVVRPDEQGRWWLPQLAAAWELLPPEELPRVTHWMDDAGTSLAAEWARYRRSLAEWQEAVARGAGVDDDEHR